MAGQKYNVGSDTKITILVNGAPFGAQIMTKFEAKQETTQTKSTAIDGRTRARELPVGWNLDMEWDRGNSIVDDFFVQEEANRYSGLQPSDVSLLEVTTNPDGTISRYRFEGVTMKQDTAGERAGDSKVTQKASAFAARRKAA